MHVQMCVHVCVHYMFGDVTADKASFIYKGAALFNLSLFRCYNNAVMLRTAGWLSVTFITHSGC